MQIRSEREFFFQAALPLFGLLLMVCVIWCNVKNITIDIENNTIAFQNIFTRVTKTYNFSEFDGYIDTFVSHGNSSSKYETIGFVCGKRVVRRIDSYYYSNHNEMRNALANCTYLGKVNFGLWDQLKMLLNQEVLE